MSTLFEPADVHLARARTILARERARLASLGIQGELELTGGTSLPRALTGGDVDLHLRVEPNGFAAAIAAISAAYDPVHAEIWCETLATFEDRDGERVGLAVTPVGSAHDRRFRAAWLRLSTDPVALAAYNDLKRRHEGGEVAAYRAAKAVFFDELDADAAERAPGATPEPARRTSLSRRTRSADTRPG